MKLNGGADETDRLLLDLFCPGTWLSRVQMHLYNFSVIDELLWTFS